MAVFVTAAVMDSAAGNDGNVCACFDIKIIINNICNPRGIYDDRNMNRFSFRFSANKHIHSRLISFLPDFYKFSIALTKNDSVVAQAVSPFR